MSKLNSFMKSCFFTIGCRCKSELPSSVSSPLHTQSTTYSCWCVWELKQHAPRCALVLAYGHVWFYIDYVWRCKRFLESGDMWFVLDSQMLVTNIQLNDWHNEWEYPEEVLNILNTQKTCSLDWSISKVVVTYQCVDTKDKHYFISYTESKRWDFQIWFPHYIKKWHPSFSVMYLYYILYCRFVKCNTIKFYLW